MGLTTAITTYNFYTTQYYGETIAEAQFNKWLSKATDKLQYLCNGRIDNAVLTTFSIPIQKATCALMDVMYNIEQATQNASNPEGGNVKSISSGSESVTFNDNGTLVSNVIGNKILQNRLMLDTIADYLADTGLMYAGEF